MVGQMEAGRGALPQARGRGGRKHGFLEDVMAWPRPEGWGAKADSLGRREHMAAGEWGLQKKIKDEPALWK